MEQDSSSGAGDGTLASPWHSGRPGRVQLSAGQSSGGVGV